MVGHHAAIGTGLQDQVQDIVRIARRCLFVHQVFGVRLKICPHRGIKGHHPKFIGGPLIQHMGGEIGVGVGDLGIAFFDQQWQVSVRRADDTAQHPHRQLAGDFFGGINGAMGQNAVKNIDSDCADVRFKRGHYRFGEGFRHFDTRLHMVGRIGFRECAAGEVFFIRLIFHPDTLRR